MRQIDARQIMQERLEEEEKNPCLVVNLKLSNGHFDSTISIPLYAPDEAKKRFIDSWLQLMEAALKCGGRP